MIRDILNLKSGENIVYEYVGEDRIFVTGENAYTDGKTFLSFNTGPTFKLGRASSFRGLDKKVKAIRKTSGRGNLSRYELILTNV